jgi:uncharacterized 2Fe-2S/4Fe-4S cluster protein (DUF4445 family)
LHVGIRADCGGKGRCGKCYIQAAPLGHLSPISDRERAWLTGRQIEDGYRLACQSEIVGPVTVTVPAVDLEERETFGKTALTGAYPVAPTVERIVLDTPLISDNANQVCRDIVQQVERHARDVAGTEVHVRDPDAIRELSQPFVVEDAITLVRHQGRGVTAVLRGRHERSLGVALDIGTTTVAAYLCDLQRGVVLTAAAAANPQRGHGEDVITRISFANEDGSGLSRLHSLIIEEVNGLIRRCVREADACEHDVDEVTVVGNTTMLELFAGLHPHSLGVAPYLPVSCASADVRAADLGLELNPGTNVHIFPVISGFVGGDTVGAIVATRPHTDDAMTLIVDIGTNGELVLGNREVLWATSCATGPALEGAHISSGMRASAGAIHSLRIDPSSYHVSYDVLGKSEATRPYGMCGSGIIDAVAAMRAAEVVLPSGRIKEGLPGVVSDDQGIARRLILVPPDKTATGREISITLADVRQVQLAKAALFTGITTLMRRSGVTHIDRLILTGAFGARFDWQNAMAIGMLPPASVVGEVQIIENAAGAGAIMALLDRNVREEAQEISRAVHFVELADDPDFAVEFAGSMSFSSGD